MTATNVVFACDESGAKGYADQVESYPGEVGVFAGILIAQENEPSAQSEFQAIIKKHTPAAGKLHIADLPASQQQTLREDVYAAIRKFDLPCFWYAVHVAGLNKWHMSQKTLLEDAKQVRAQPPRVKLNSARDNPASMHQSAFRGPLRAPHRVPRGTRSEGIEHRDSN